MPEPLHKHLMPLPLPLPRSTMPTRHYDDAFAMLEKSFNDSSFMKAYQALPVKKEDSRVNGRPPMRYYATAMTDGTATTHDEDEDDDDEGASDSSIDMHEGYGHKATPPLVLSRKRTNVSLPPTPPTCSRETSSSTANLTPASQDRSRLGTPVLQQGPPTPDLTPPNTRDKGLQPFSSLAPQIPVSRAESFITAREDPSTSSARTSSLSLPLAESSAGKNWLDATRSMRLAAVGLTMPGDDQDEEDEDDMGDGQLTPTRDTRHASLQSGHSINTLRKKLSTQESGDDADDDVDTDNNNFLRNVTIRKKRRKPDLNGAAEALHNGRRPRDKDNAFISQNHALQIEERRRDDDEDPSMPRDVVDNTTAPTVESAEPYQPAAQAEQGESQMAINDMLYRAIREEKSKRLSGISQTSTTVEAVVIAGPQQKKRTLRRVGKNLALREDLSSPRASIDSPALQSCSHSLRHKKAHLPNRKDLLREEARDTTRSVSNPERYRVDRVQVIVIPERRASLAPRPPSPLLRRHDEKMHLLTHYQHQLHHSQPSSRRLRAGFGSDTAALSRKEHAETNHEPQTLQTTSPRAHAETQRERQFQTPPPEAFFKGSPLRLRHVSAPMHSGRSPRSSYHEDAFEQPSRSSPDIDMIQRLGWNGNSSTDPDPVSPMSEHAPSASSSISPLPSPSPSLDRQSHAHSSSVDYHTANGTIHSTPAKSNDDGNILGLFDYGPTSPHRSVDPYHANARNLLSAQTPGSMSQFSDRTVECAEAQTVNFYPHGNNSLLVVQHVSSNSRPKVRRLDTRETKTPPSIVDEVETPSTTSSSAMDITGNNERGLRPIFTVQEPSPVTSTTDTHTVPAKGVESARNVDLDSTNNPHDSPLTNPRPAPMPPVIIIPPTPSPRPHLARSHSSSSSLSNRSSSRPMPPQRRQSLIQKARRYSETFIQPFLGPSRANSTNKRHSTGSTHSLRPTSATERTQTLHPFWRPRGFWDDFSDSDSDDGSFFYGDEELAEEDRLPAGGDTSDVESLKQSSGMLNGWPRKMSVRMQGFRGQGGFLVGNSLGIERWGSNRRRHYIWAPTAPSSSAKRGPVDDDMAVDVSGGPSGVKSASHRRALSLPFFTQTTMTSSRPTTAHTLRKKRSGDLLRDFTYSTESLRQRALRQKKGGLGLGKYRIRAVGVKEFRARMGQKWLEREEKKREVRRRELMRLISRPIGGGGDV